MPRIHCCGCDWRGNARTVGRGFICGGCASYVVPCAACREKAQAKTTERTRDRAPAGPSFGQVVADVLRAALLGRERAELQLVQTPLEVEGLGMPEPELPPAADIEQQIKTAQMRAALAKTKETVER